VPGYAAELGAKMLGELSKLEGETAIVGEVRGIGLMFGIEIVRDRKTKEPASDLAKKVRAYAHRRGVMIEVGGHHGNVARLLPPLIISEDLAMKGVEIISQVIKDIEHEM
jgi:4-aminobutyrate aminotransferase-like enzyme